MPDIQLAEKKTVLQILESFKGTGPLRELLAQLNYDPLNEPVSRKEWPEPAQVALAQDPRLYGRAAGEFYVVYAQLAADKLKLTDERTVIPQLLKQYPYALFVFSDKAQSNFHFVNVKWENNQKRRLYRRITVGPQERMRTAAERLSMLDIQTIDAGLFGVTAQHIQDRHDEAFDVAKVSKSFFDEYKRVFEVMRDAVKGFGTSDEEQDRRHLFTQRLFNRLMFLRFIQKKGWLTIDGSTDYLAALWASHGKLKQDGKNFYTDRLRLLFAALNNERAGIVLQGGGGAVEATIGKVKYLNGGLFEETDEDKDPKVRIADEPFKQIFDKASGLFEAFNFTITESTPLDVEIAVDPEMLGKIFEELVTGRHDSGSYYTPKSVVSFMCREALKGYLETQVPTENRQAIIRFVDKHEPEDVHDAEAVLNALRRVTVCDPACGSGAYLLGMMHELLDLRQCLFQTRRVDEKTMYQRKLDIIQTNIYGVDIAEFAVNIARLRLWLSLAVDYDGPEPQPLPNLDYKIEIGDSVSSPSPGALQIGIQQRLVDQMLELKRTYLSSHHGDKIVLRQKIDSLRQEIRAFSFRDGVGFDWVIDFAEIFVQGGFDVIIANPPYRKERDAKHLMELIKASPLWKEWSQGKMDLWYFFLHRALELTREHGLIHFITSRYWVASVGAKKLIGRLQAETAVRIIFDFGDFPVFENVDGQHMTGMYQKTRQHEYPFTIKRVTDNELFFLDAVLSPTSTAGVIVETFDNDAHLFRIPGVLSLGAADNSDCLIEKTAIRTVPLETFFEVRQGIAQNPDKVSRKAAEKYNLNAGAGVFVVTDQELAAMKLTKKEHEFVKPFIEEREIHQFACEPHGGKWLLYLTTHNVTSLSNFPNLQKHLEPFRQIMEVRRETVNGSNKWFHLHWPREDRLFNGPKIVAPQMAAVPTFAYSDQPCFIGLSATVIKARHDDADLFALLGILNSDAAATWFSLHSKERGVGLDIGGGVLRQFPLPIALSGPEIDAISTHSKILFNKISDGKTISGGDMQLLNTLVDSIYRPGGTN